MPTPKYIALIITRSSFFVNADGTPMPMTPQPTEMEAMLDAFKPEHERRFMFVEVYSKYGEFSSNSVRGIINDLNAKPDAPYDAIFYFTRKAGKPFQSQPVGQTWLPA